MKNRSSVFLPILFVFLLSAFMPLYAQMSALSGKGNANYSGGAWSALNNDYRTLPDGIVHLGGVDFDLAAGENNCILLGGAESGWSSSYELKFDEPLKGSHIYLLNSFPALAKGRDAKAVELEFLYKDGTVRKEALVNGKNAGSWKGFGDGTPDAVPAWGEYTLSDYAELQVCKFPITGELAAIRANVIAADAKWALFGVTAGKDTRLLAKVTFAELTGDCIPAERFTEEEIAQFPADLGTPKNIILIIGDGMGTGALNYASSVAYGAPGRLLMEQLPVKGLCQTYSANSDVTDSAASGTALATGHKTNNGMVGMQPDGTKVTSIAGEAKKLGKAVGIFTTDSLYGATPAAFAAHTPNRGNKEDIHRDYLACGYDIALGSGAELESFQKEFEGTDIAVVSTGDEFKAAGAKAYGMAVCNSNTDVGGNSGILLDKLSRNPNGFFAMIECSWPDYGGHGNNPNLTVSGVTGADYAVRAAVEFARRDPSTLIVVTADHETGGIVMNQRMADAKAPVIFFQAKSHTGAPVGIFAAGPGASRFNGILNNVDIPRIFADLWGIPVGQVIEDAR